MDRRAAFAAALITPLVLAGVAALPSQAVPPSPTGGARPAAEPHSTQARPPRATGLAVYQDGSTVTFTWHNPRKLSTARAVVRYTRGRVAPKSPDKGTAVPVRPSGGETAVVSGLAADTTYSATVWIRDAKRRLSAPTQTTFTTAAAINRGKGQLTGIVTDREHAPLSGVVVSAIDYTGYATFSAVTGSDGRYRLSVPAAKYVVEFLGANGQGGDSDATGYQSTYAFTTVARAKAAVNDAALRAGAEITGIVTDPAGSPVAGVGIDPQPINPYVFPDVGGGSFASYFEIDGSDATTAADGTFALKGLSHQDFLPCFDPTGLDVSGGSGQGSGYTRRCLSSPLLLSAGVSRAVGQVVLQPRPGGSLSGTVLSPTGDGVSYADVTVYPAGRKAPVGDTGTDSDGRYRLDGLAAGTYRVCAAVYGGPETTHGFGYAPHCRTRTVAVTQAHRSTADVTLRTGGAASGTVTTATGLPVANATVMVTQAGGDSGSVTTTDARGHWTAVGLPAGRFTACVDTSSARTPGAAFGALSGCFANRRTFRVQQGRNRIDVEIQLRTAAAITGRIVDTTGRPMSGGAVFTYSDNGTFAFASVGRNGYFVIADLGPGKYHVCGLAYGDEQKCRHTPVVARSAHLSRHVDFAFPLRGSLQVSVRDEAGHPLAGVDAAALVPCRQFCDKMPAFGRPFHVAATHLTRANGIAVLRALRPGSYAVCAFGYDAARTNYTPPTGYADACADHAFDVAVGIGKQATVTVTLPPAGEVTGKVTDSAGNPLRGVRVNVSGSAAADAPQGWGDPGDPTADAVTAADGTYAIRSVSAGDQTVCFGAGRASGGTSAAGYVSQCLGGTPGGTTGTPVAVKAGEVASGQNIALTSAGGISGTVTNAAGTRPGKWASVAVFAATGNREIGQAIVHKDGAYRVTRLPAGDYRVCFGGTGYINECYDNQPWTGGHLPSGTTSVTVTAGAVMQGIDAVLKKR